MKRHTLFTLLVGTLLVFHAPVARSADPNSATPETPEAPASPIGLSGSMSFASRYLFQGIDYSAAKPVMNPEADLTWGPIGAKLWVNHDLDQRVSNEYDFSILHEWALKKLSITTGYTYLWYPHRDGWTPSQEVYLEASREGALNPALSVHYDFDAGMGSYSTFGLSHGFERRRGPSRWARTSSTRITTTGSPASRRGGCWLRWGIGRRSSRDAGPPRRGVHGCSVSSTA